MAESPVMIEKLEASPFPSESPSPSPSAMLSRIARTVALMVKVMTVAVLDRQDARVPLKKMITGPPCDRLRTPVTNRCTRGAMPCVWTPVRHLTEPA